MHTMYTCLSNSYIPQHLRAGMEEKKGLQEMAEKKVAESASDNGTFTFNKCTMERSGDITCTISKGEFEKVSGSGVKPNRLVFEIKD